MIHLIKNMMIQGMIFFYTKNKCMLFSSGYLIYFLYFYILFNNINKYF